MKVRLVWPGLLAIIGTSTFFGLIWFFLTLPFNLGEGVGPGYGPIIPALILGWIGLLALTFGILLMMDEANHTIWGSLLAVLYSFASYFLIPDLLFSLSSFNTLNPLWEVAGVLGLILGLVGGIWGFFWKTVPLHSG